MYDANGCPNLPVTQSGYPLVGANMGALVARIGSTGPVFLLGDGPSTLPSGQTGQLFLVINDDLSAKYGAGLKDNHGYVTVQITMS